MITCLYCDGPHPWWDCRKKPEDWRPADRDRAERVSPQSSSRETVGVGSVIAQPVPSAKQVAAARAALDAAPVPKDNRHIMPGSLTPETVKTLDRHSPGYMRDYMRKRRAKARNSKG